MINIPDKNSSLRIRIRDLFEKNQGRYGYRRIYVLLIREGIRISEKVICRIMKEQNITIYQRKRKRYESYKGEITSAVENIISRNFHVEKPAGRYNRVCHSVRKNISFTYGRLF